MRLCCLRPNPRMSAVKGGGGSVKGLRMRCIWANNSALYTAAVDRAKTLGLKVINAVL
jgi:hypothetical protein